MSTYKEPLTNMEIDENNLDKWKKQLKQVTFVPNNILLNVDIQSPPNDVASKKTLYYERVKTFVLNKSPHLLRTLVSVNKSRRNLQDRKIEYNECMRKYIKSIKYFKDKYNQSVVVKLVLNNDKDKLMAYLQYYNYKKNTMNVYEPKKIIDFVNDFILKNRMYGLYIDDLMVGFLTIENNRKFNIDDSNGKVDTFYIQEVYIDKNMRGRMLGKILLDYAILLCPIHKKYISLMTYEHNPIINIALSKHFVLQKSQTECPINKLLFIRSIEEKEFSQNYHRITASI